MLTRDKYKKFVRDLKEYEVKPEYWNLSTHDGKLIGWFTTNHFKKKDEASGE